MYVYALRWRLPHPSTHCGLTPTLTSAPAIPPPSFLVRRFRNVSHSLPWLQELFWGSGSVRSPGLAKEMGSSPKLSGPCA